MQKESLPFGAKATNLFNRSFSQNFERSIIRLAVFYALIFAGILLLSGLITFSVFAFRSHHRFNRGTIIVQNMMPQAADPRVIVAVSQPMPRPLPPVESQLREDLIESLVMVNTLLVMLSALFGYWLARRTLQPIRNAYEKQQQFLADASHELRTPLAILHLDLENELHGAKGEAKNRAESNLQEVQRMSKLVNDLLLLSRLDQAVAQDISAVDLGVLSSDVVDRLQPLASAHDVVVTAASAEGCLVLAHADTVFHAVTNIVHNAIAYNKPNGTVIVTVAVVGAEYVVAVADTGVGIAEQDVARIFDRFYRADKSRTRSTGGSGLGLAIAHAAVERSGGTIAIESAVGVGTTVTIRFPRKA